jgi:hypothetical protein
MAEEEAVRQSQEKAILRVILLQDRQTARMAHGQEGKPQVHQPPIAEEHQLQNQEDLLAMTHIHADQALWQEVQLTLQIPDLMLLLQECRDLLLQDHRIQEVHLRLQALIQEVHLNQEDRTAHIPILHRTVIQDGTAVHHQHRPAAVARDRQVVAEVAQAGRHQAVHQEDHGNPALI